MLRFLIICLALSVSGCEKVLIKPRLNATAPTVSTDAVDIAVTAVQPSRKVITAQNQKPFERRVKVVSEETGRLSLVSFDTYTQENRPKSSRQWIYRVGVGDILSIRRPSWALMNSVSPPTDAFFDEEVIVHAGGDIILSDGLRINVAGKTVDQISQEINAQHKLAEKFRVENVSLSEFPTETPVEYRVGSGDTLSLGRVVPVIDPQTQLSSDKTITIPLFVDEFGKIQVIELEGEIKVDGLTISEIREVLRTEFLRAGLASEFTVQMQGYGSQAVTVTGDFGSTSIFLRPRYYAWDRILQSVFTSASEANALPYPDLSSIVLHLDRGGQRYAMYASSILIDEPLGKYFAQDGDRLVIKKVYPEASTKVSVNSYRSQYVSLVQSGDIRDSDPSAEETEIKDARSRRIFIDAQGLRLRDLIADYNLWPEPGSDVMIKLYRENNLHRFSVARLMREPARAAYYLQHKDIIEVESLITSADKYFVVGETGKPIAENVSNLDREFLTDAIFESNLFENASADLRHVYLVRENGSDSFNAFHFDFSDVTRLDLARRMEMRPNDIVLVQTQPIYEYNLFTSLLLGVFNNPVFAQATSQ